MPEAPKKVEVLGGGTLVVPKGEKRRKKPREPLLETTVNKEAWVLFTSLYRGGDVCRFALPLGDAYQFLAYNYALVIGQLVVWLVTRDLDDKVV